MDVETILLRAASALGKKTRYESPGDMPDLAAASWPQNGAHVDCSGFIAWCIRFPRKIDHPLYRQVNGGWFETTAIYADGQSSVGYFTELTKPRPGAFLVYPDYKGTDGKRHDGHIGVVTQVKTQGSGIEAVDKVIHCSLGGWTAKKDAVQETAPSPWLKHDRSLIVWLDGTT